MLTFCGLRYEKATEKPWKNHENARNTPKHCFSKPRNSHEKVTSKNVTSDEKSSDNLKNVRPASLAEINCLNRFFLLVRLGVCRPVSAPNWHPSRTASPAKIGNAILAILLFLFWTCKRMGLQQSRLKAQDFLRKSVISDAAFLLTVGSSLLTVSFFAYSCVCEPSFAYSLSFFTYSWSFCAYSWASLLYSAEVRLRSTSMDCKQSSTVSKKAPTVG